MGSIKVVTNHAWRAFRYRHEVPAKVLSNQFDWTNDAHEKNGDYSDGFVRYRGIWYHLADFQRGSLTSELGWDGAHGDSFFSGIVIRLSKDGESYQIGTYYQTDRE